MTSDMIKVKCVDGITPSIAREFKEITNNIKSTITFNDTIVELKYDIDVVTLDLLYGDDVVLTSDDESIFIKIKNIIMNVTEEV